MYIFGFVMSHFRHSVKRVIRLNKCSHIDNYLYIYKKKFTEVPKFEGFGLIKWFNYRCLCIF